MQATIDDSKSIFLILTLDSLPKCLVKIIDDVLIVLQTNADPYQVLRDPKRYPLLFLNRGVGHRVGQLSQRFITTQGLGQSDHLQDDDNNDEDWLPTDFKIMLNILYKIQGYDYCLLR